MESHSTVKDSVLEVIADDEECQRTEAALWWLVGRKVIIREWLKRAAACRPITEIMDIGCGSGGNLDVLSEFGSVIGVERSETLARRARSRGIAKAVFTQDARDLDNCSHVDVFTMFDVLEHIEQDAEFLSQLRKKHSHKHFLLMSVPACPSLFGDHDRILHHYRRYSARQLRHTLESGGYEVQRISYFMFFLFPFALLCRLKDKIMSSLGIKRSTVDIANLPRCLSVPFSVVLKTEGYLSRWMRFPAGLWLFVLATSKAEVPLPDKFATGDVNQSGSVPFA